MDASQHEALLRLPGAGPRLEPLFSLSQSAQVITTPSTRESTYPIANCKSKIPPRNAVAVDAVIGYEGSQQNILPFVVTKSGQSPCISTQTRFAPCHKVSGDPNVGSYPGSGTPHGGPENPAGPAGVGGAPGCLEPFNELTSTLDGHTRTKTFTSPLSISHEG